MPCWRCAAVSAAIAAGHLTRHRAPGTETATSPEPDLRLWYRQPAATWNEALPIGNGRLGAMVFGGVERGAPAAQRRHGLGRREARPAEPGGRRGGQGSAAAARRREGCAGRGAGRQGDHRDAAPHAAVPAARRSRAVASRTPSAATDYQRELDLRDAIARVRYTVEDTIFTREVFSSAVDQAIVVRLTKDRPREDQLHRAALARAGRRRRARTARTASCSKARRSSIRRRRDTSTSARPACASPPRCRPLPEGGARPHRRGHAGRRRRRMRSRWC